MIFHEKTVQSGKNNMCEVKIDKKADKTIIKIEGKTSIESAVSLKEKLLESITESAKLSFQLDKVTETDSSFLQIIAALDNSIKDKGKEADIEGKLSPDLLSAVRSNGYFRKRYIRKPSQDGLVGKIANIAWSGK